MVENKEKKPGDFVREPIVPASLQLNFISSIGKLFEPRYAYCTNDSVKEHSLLLKGSIPSIYMIICADVS